MNPENVDANEMQTDINPYLPPSLPGTRTTIHDRLKTLWDLGLIGLVMMLTAPMAVAVGWTVSRQFDPASGITTPDLLSQLARITQMTSFYLLFLLSLSTPFWNPRGVPWRAVFVAEAVVLLIDFSWLRPTAQSIAAALIFVVLVLPVILRGYGWVGVCMRLWKLLTTKPKTGPVA